MLEVLKAILFGIVEGITEWLPISSTGHMILLNELMPLKVGENPEAFYSMYEVVIQLGAIMAVVVLFWNKLWPFGNNKDSKKIWTMWIHILISCVPAAVIGLLLDDYFEALFYNFWTVAIMLILFGVAFIIVETVNKKKKPVITKMSQINIKIALIIGLFQVIAAIFPGTSRSGATIVGALLIGVSRSLAAEYTFFLAVPVMFGASLLKIVKYGLAFTGFELFILVLSMIVAFVVSVVVIKFLMDYIKKHDFKVFGYYRIILGIIVLIVGFCLK